MSPLYRLIPAVLITSLFSLVRGELIVSTDFEGGSARIGAINQETGVIRFQPGGDPQRGWPCWWYLRIDGLPDGQSLKLELEGSDLPARNNGKDTGKRLSPDWAMPASAAWSSDGKIWRHTGLGTREVDRITYELTGTGGPLWVAWGPPFTTRECDRLIDTAEKTLPDLARSFELARSREGRAVRGLHWVGAGEAKAKPAVWIQARQHAWESGSSWVAQGLTDWLTGDEAEARQLREQAEIWIVPIMDVDNVATGNGGKEAHPHDHNRDWTDQPHYPEVAAAQKHLRALASEGRLAVFLDLHNPAARDTRPFFFVGPPEILSDMARTNRDRFLTLAEQHIIAPLALDPKPRVTGPNYHPLWRQISGQWVNDHGNPHTLAACLETSWNTRHSTTEGYREVGRQLAQAVAEYLRKP